MKVNQYINYKDYVTPKVVPWADVFDDLSKVGRCPSQICQLIGVPWATLHRWKTGECEPKHSIGVAILLLHARYCGEELTIQRECESKDMVQLRPRENFTS